MRAIQLGDKPDVQLRLLSTGHNAPSKFSKLGYCGGFRTAPAPEHLAVSSGLETVLLLEILRRRRFSGPYAACKADKERLSLRARGCAMAWHQACILTHRH